MLNYYNPITEQGYIYSIDNCRIDFVLSPDRAEDFTHYLESSIHFEDSPINSKPFKFRYLTTARYDADSSMTVGFSFNGINKFEDKYKGFLDFNPNKVGGYEAFWHDYRILKACFKSMELKRVDLAVDIPLSRDLFIIVKDKRKYKLDYMSASNKTEYLGKRSNIGFVKLYNKTIESGLTKDLTRLEITIAPNAESFFIHLPALYNIRLPIQLELESTSLTDTDRWILKAEYLLLVNHLDDGCVGFKELGRKKYEKLKPFLLPDSSRISFSEDAVKTVLDTFNEHFI